MQSLMYVCHRMLHTVSRHILCFSMMKPAQVLYNKTLNAVDLIVHKSAACTHLAHVPSMGDMK